MIKRILISLSLVILFATPFMFQDFRDSMNGVISSVKSYEEVNQEVIEITEITDSSSEVNGKWKGLCPKNSIKTVEDFKNMVDGDKTLSQYYSGFDFDNARMGNSEESLYAYVAHRTGNTIKKTRKPIKLPKGDAIITDGTKSVRAFCCNDIEMTPSAGTPDVKIVPSAGVPIAELPVIYPSEPVFDTPTYANHYSPVYYERSSPRPPETGSEPVPEPETLLLFGSGLILFAYLKRDNE